MATVNSTALNHADAERKSPPAHPFCLSIRAATSPRYTGQDQTKHDRPFYGSRLFQSPFAAVASFEPNMGHSAAQYHHICSGALQHTERRQVRIRIH